MVRNVPETIGYKGAKDTIGYKGAKDTIGYKGLLADEARSLPETFTVRGVPEWNNRGVPEWNNRGVPEWNNRGVPEVQTVRSLPTNFTSRFGVVSEAQGLQDVVNKALEVLSAL